MPLTETSVTYDIAAQHGINSFEEFKNAISKDISDRMERVAQHLTDTFENPNHY